MHLTKYFLAALGFSQAAIAQNSGNCELGGRVIENSESHYFTGRPYLPGSFYAVCHSGVPSCFEDDGKADIADPTKPCSSLADAQRRLGVVVPPQDQTEIRWPGGALCFRSVDGLTAQQQQVFMQSVSDYNKKTNIRVLSMDECQAQTDAATICGGCQHAIQVNLNADGCYSYVGYRKEANQEMGLSPRCFRESRIISHEIAHALGLFHEHTHPQREVIMLRDGFSVPVSNYLRSDFAAASKYDPVSIMHYPLGRSMCAPKAEYANTRFCDAGEDAGTDGCIIPQEEHCDRTSPMQERAGNAKELSLGDVGSFNFVYKDIANPRPPTPTVAPTPAPTPAPVPTPAPPAPDAPVADAAEQTGFANLAVAASPEVLDGTAVVVTSPQNMEADEAPGNATEEIVPVSVNETIVAPAVDPVTPPTTVASI